MQISSYYHSKYNKRSVQGYKKVTFTVYTQKYRRTMWDMATF